MLLNKYLSYVTQEDVETSRPLTLVQLLLPGWWSLLRLMFSSVACHNYLIFLSFYFFLIIFIIFFQISICVCMETKLCVSPLTAGKVTSLEWTPSFLSLNRVFGEICMNCALSI